MVRHSCPIDNCTSTFSRPYRLRIHIQRHQGIKEYQCTQCDRGYHRRQHLRRHVAVAHESQSRSEEPLTCDHCNLNFNTVWGLRRHQVKIKKEKNHIRQYQCDVCRNRFYNPDDLKRHSLKHERFKCVIPSCPLTAHKFKWKFYNEHLTTYHSEPFSCEHCGERFFIKSQIRKHVAKHMPKFNCTQPGCNKTFTLKRNLVQHIQIGHGARLYKCSVIGCDWEFKYKSSFLRHIVKIHQQNGRIVTMANKFNKKEPKFVMAKKLAGLALKV